MPNKKIVSFFLTLALLGPPLNSALAEVHDNIPSATSIVTFTTMSIPESSSSPRSSNESAQNESAPSGTTESATVVIVNGEEQLAGIETVKMEDNKVLVSIEVDENVINQKITEIIEQRMLQPLDAPQQNIVEIPVSNQNADQIVINLTQNMVKAMADEGFRLSINSGNTNFIVPTQEFAPEEISKIIGTTVTDVTVNITIEKTDAQKTEEIKEKAKEQGLEVLTAPIHFTISVTGKDSQGQVHSVRLSQYSQYTQRIIKIPEGVDSSKITTGIYYNTDGFLSHIPTEVFTDNNGNWYATMNSLTDSDYTVVYNPVTVEAVANHWSKDHVNDIASRLIIKNPATFQPDQAITRGEFAEYITKALGIYRTQKAREGIFSDIESHHPLGDAITIASDYNLIQGYPDRTFRSHNIITREEAINLYARAMTIVALEKERNQLIENYSDKEKISPWAYDGVHKVISAGIFKGKTSETINPQDIFTYAEAATAIRNLLTEATLINQ
ncbi:S-layer homology domain-containing protein [Heliorestis convoluta]|uniref:S-layer domain protein, putative n=1 Tax=Heliorestis convoluta TaxID=356322 RepID=A0A5Q2MY74_9FIRM|nr:S-layer homology domain-containing protein [Heliorestis convoluta]QGG47577.1 S-layer domain protein, putative [Heliorestis convoluta]